MALTKRPANTIFLKVDLPVHVMAELDETLAHYGCWRSRAAFIREVVERWLEAWRAREVVGVGGLEPPKP